MHLPSSFRHRCAVPAAAVLFGGLLASSLPARAQTLAPGDPSTQFTLSGWVPGMTNVMDTAPLPDGRLVVVQNGGDVAVRTKDGMVVKVAGHIEVKRLTATEHGLLGVVPHPDFAQNHILFFHASVGDTVADKNQVFRGTLSDDNKLTFDLANPIIKIESPEKHNGSMMIIHKGMLYMGVGDSGADATPPVIHYPSCLNKPNGKILRMNLDGSAPADNPLSGLAMVTGCTTANRTSGDFTMQPPEKRIWAWGFRQPYRFWVDPVTDLVWVGDVGEKGSEEIDIVEKGKHYGYPFVEGTHPYTQAQQPWNTFGGCKGMTPSTECAAPAYSYPIGGGDGCILGGFILDGCGWPDAYKSRYMYGDFDSNHIYTVDVTPDRKGVVPNSRKLFANFSSINGFRMGADGAVYVTGFMQTAVFRIVPKNRPASCDQLPAAGDGGVPTTPADASADAETTPGAGGASGEGGATGAGGSPAPSGGTTGNSDGGKGDDQAGGSGGKSTGGTRAGGATGAGGSDDGEPATKDSMPAGGCACTTAGSPGATATLPGLLLAALYLRRRRRPRR